MHYPSPHSADLGDVRALNRAYLDILAQDRCRHPALTDEDVREQLSRVPFLVFRLRGTDPAWWGRVLTQRGDLLDASRPTPLRWTNLVTAALGFLWHLARRDTHGARLFSGESSEWFNAIATMPLVQLTHGAVANGLEPSPRFDEQRPEWEALVRAAEEDDPCRFEQASLRIQHRQLAAAQSGIPRRSAACRSRVIASELTGL